MTQILADNHLPERLKTLTEPAQVVDETGRTLGIYEPLTLALPGVAAAHSPNTEEKPRELRNQRDGGLPLAEVLKQLGAK